MATVEGAAVAGRVLDIHLLGPIGAERHGEAVSLGGPRQRAVLARLALVPGQVVTVDRLVDDVWAGDPPATAVNTLQSYVSLLRRALGDPLLLRREGPGYVLSIDRHLLDASRFEDEVAAARASLATDPEGALHHLAQALGEWHGPVLADVADEEWARPAAVRLDDLRLEALETRFDALLALGRHGEAVPELERAVDEYPLREGFARRLMLALYRSGRQAEALRVFARTREVLAEELGLDPTPELAALQTRILNHDPELAAPGPAASPDAVVGDPRAGDDPTAFVPSPVPLPGPAARAAAGQFVGRDEQLARLHRLWLLVLGGNSHLALLHGEAGAGKSRLAAEFAAQAHELGAVVLWGRATAEAIVPFEPMVEAIRTVLRTVSNEARRRVAAERGLLALLLPELEQLVPDVRVERPEPAVERYLLFETVAELLRDESARHPMLIVLDDLQWADAPSLKMIDHVLRHELPGRVMVIGTVRVPGDAPTPELDRVASELARDGLLTRIVVGALATSSIAELLRASGADVTRAAELETATGGNAFFVSELIHHAGGVIDAELPESIRAMIGLRLDSLDPRVVQVLNLAAVAGPAATLAVLGEASGLDGDDLLDATDAAVAAGLLVEDGAGRLAVRHALIGQAIRGRLGRTRRLDLHRRIALAIEHTSEPQVTPGMLAHHLLAAGSLVEREVRVAAGLAAARHSLAVGAYEDAAGWVERLHALVTERVGIVDRTEVALVACDVFRALGNRAEAIESARTAAAGARRTGRPMLLARAAEGWMMSLSGVGFDIGRPADADLVELLEEAIASLPPENHQYQVRMRSMLTSVLVPSPDRARRQQLADEALAIAEADGDPELLASAYLARRLALWHLDALPERAEAVLRAVREVGRTQNVELELTTMLFALSDLLELGRVDEQQDLLARFRARAAEVHMPLFEVYGEFAAASHLLSTGAHEEAERVAAAALAKGIRSHGFNAEVAHTGVRFRLAVHRGQLAARVEECQEMVARNRLRMWQIALVRSLVAAGRHEEAKEHLDELVGPDRLLLKDNPTFLVAAATLTEALHDLGDSRRAAIARQALEPYADRIGVSGLAGISIGPISGYLGLAAHTTGDLDAAERWLRQAIAVDERFGLRPYEARSRHALAAVLAERGRRGDVAQAAAEEATARLMAAEIGLVLPLA